MRADFELVARGLVDVRRTQQVETLDAGRQRNGTLDDSAGTLGGFDDFLGGLIDQAIVESFEADADFWLCMIFPKSETASPKARRL